MKRFLLFALAATMFAACVTDATQDTVVGIEVPETLTVSFEEDSRIQLQEGKTVWTKGDLVSVFYRSNANQKWQYQGETGERTGNLKRVENATGTTRTTKTVVVYPYSESYWLNTDSYAIEAILPATQNYAEGSYGVGSNLMVSQSEFTQFSLKSVCGWLKIQLKGEGQVVKTITLKGNNGEQVAGLIYVDTATAESTLASEMGGSDDNNAGGNLVFEDTILKEVTLSCSEGVVLGAEATAFYIALPPQTFAKGISLKIVATDGSTMKKSTEKEVVIERNHILPMAELEYEGKIIVPDNEIWYTATQKIEPYYSANFGANIISNEWDESTGRGVITFDGDVTSIGEKAFTGYNTVAEYSLISIAIPDTVISICRDAFNRCENLTTVTIGNGVTTIENSTFTYCDSLTNIILPNSLTSIGSFAFQGCTSLTSITIPDSVTVIGENPFCGCTSLRLFKGKYAEDSGRVLIKDSKLIAYADASGTTYTIPDNVLAIYDYAFMDCTSLTSVIIPDSVTSIGEAAFYCCSSLTSATISDSVTSIESSAFSDCRSLTSVVIPNKVTEIRDYTFHYCSNLTSVTIPDSVTSIGEYAFKGCRSLTSIYCKPTNPPTIDYDAFPENSGMKIYVPYTSGMYLKSWKSYIDYIVGYDFDKDEIAEIHPYDEIWYTTSDENIITPKNFYSTSPYIHIESNTYSNGKGIIKFSGDVTLIPESAFSGNSKLTSIAIPNSVTEIGPMAFDNCTSLTNIVIPDSVTFIGVGAFQMCASLTNVTIGNGVALIARHAFSGCPSLTAFYGKFASADNRCLVIDGVLNSFAPAGLTEYMIPDNVTSIGDAAFIVCTLLTNVIIPDSVTSIRELAFSGCNSLTSVTIPDGVTSIGQYAFNYCISLKEVYCKPTTPPMGGSYMFYDNASGRKIYVPTASVEAYKAKQYWSGYADYIEGYDF